MPDDKKDIVLSVLRNADHKNDKDCTTCARCNNGILLQKVLREYGLIVISNTANSTIDIGQLLATMESYTRARRKIQNEEGRYPPSDLVYNQRQNKRIRTRDRAIELKKEPEITINDREFPQKPLNERREIAKDLEKKDPALTPSSKTRRVYKNIWS